MSPHVLVVEDDSALVAEIDEAFRAQSLDAEFAPTATAAVMALQKGRFDAILLDLLLPDGHGLQVLDVLRANSRKVPVIVMTRFLKDYQKELVDYFPEVQLVAPKPFSAKTMAATMAAVIAKSEE
jgi:two-component system OmpR family response regulator